MVDVQCMSKILTDSDVILMVGGATTRCRPLRAYSLLRTAMDRARIAPRSLRFISGPAKCVFAHILCT